MVDWQELMPPREACGTAEALGRGAHLLVARSEQEDERRDYERLCATAEAFIYVAPGVA
jgi:hypothetical protein